MKENLILVTMENGEYSKYDDVRQYIKEAAHRVVKLIEIGQNVVQLQE